MEHFATLVHKTTMHTHVISIAINQVVALWNHCHAQTHDWVRKLGFKRTTIRIDGHSQIKKNPLNEYWDGWEQKKIPFTVSISPLWQSNVINATWARHSNNCDKANGNWMSREDRINNVEIYELHLPCCKYNCIYVLISFTTMMCNAKHNVRQQNSWT